MHGKYHNTAKLREHTRYAQSPLMRLWRFSKCCHMGLFSLTELAHVYLCKCIDTPMPCERKLRMAIYLVTLRYDATTSKMSKRNKLTSHRLGHPAVAPFSNVGAYQDNRLGHRLIELNETMHTM